MSFVVLRTYTTPQYKWCGQYAAEISIGRYRCTLEGATTSERAVIEAVGLVYRAFRDPKLLAAICEAIAPQDRSLVSKAIESENRWRQHGTGR
jgi:hypothetical protein